MNTTTETAGKYAENIAFNIQQARARRNETFAFIAECERAIAETDGRKRNVLETLNRRLEQARAEVVRLEEKIHGLDTLEAHAEEIADIDDQINALCARRRELTDNDALHSYVRTKAYGMI